MSRKYRALASLSPFHSGTKFSSTLPYCDWQAVNIFALHGKQANDKYKMVKEIKQAEELARDKIINFPGYVYLTLNVYFLINYIMKGVKFLKKDKGESYCLFRCIA